MNVLRMIAVAAFTLVPMEAASQGLPGAADRGPDHAETVSVQLSSFRFTPATIRLRQGQAYDLHLENLSPGGHDFAAGEFFAAARIAAADRAKLSGGKVALGGRESVDLHLVAPRAGTYKVRCTHFMHGAFGMTGQIVVQ